MKVETESLAGVMAKSQLPSTGFTTKKVAENIQKQSITQKVISCCALFNPFTGYYILNNSKSSEKFHCPQN